MSHGGWGGAAARGERARKKEQEDLSQGLLNLNPKLPNLPLSQKRRRNGSERKLGLSFMRRRSEARRLLGFGENSIKRCGCAYIG